VIQPLPYDDEHLVPPEAPYPGLRPFKSSESGIFCGRARQVDEVIAGLDDQHFCAVLGGSGCGKSSLIRAGVIPKLLAYGIEDRGDSWLSAVFTPGDQPIERMAQALERLLSPPPDHKDREARILAIAEDLRGPRGLVAFDEMFREDRVPEEDKALRLRTNVLVVVDQFEEIFRKENKGNPDAEHLVRCISHVQRNPDEYPRIFIILTMRTEDLHNCATFLRLPDVLNKTFFLTGRLNETELSQAILYPARLFVPEGAQLESYSGPPRYDPRPFRSDVLTRLNEAASEIRDDPDHLPLLQHFLFHIWRSALDRWDPDGSEPFAITDDDLEVSAGAKHANEHSILRRCVANHADGLYERLGPAQRTIAETLFRLLAEVDDKGVYKRQWTNRQKIAEVRRAKLEDIREDLDAVILTFANPDPYIRIDGETPTKTEDAEKQTDKTDEKIPTNKIDVSHESFIRNWPLFGEWLRNELDKSKIYDELILSNKNEKPKGDRIDNKTLTQIEDILKVGDCSYEWAQRYNDIVKKYYGNDISEDGCREIYHEACDFYAQSLNSQNKEIEEEKQNIERMARLKEQADRKQKEIEEQKERHRLAMKTEKLQNEIALQKENKRKFFFGAFSLIAIVLLAASLWTFNVYREQANLDRERARLENERTRVEREWAKREATAFQPYAVASAIKGPVSLLPENLRVERLWEAAVALRALDTLEEDKFVEANRDLSVRHLRLERASRLAHELSNHAVREIMRSVPWRLHDTQADSQPAPSSSTASSMDSASKPKVESMRFNSLKKKGHLYDCWLRVNDLALAKQKGQSSGESGSGGGGQQTDGSAYGNLLVAGDAHPSKTPSKGVLYNKERGLLAFATISENVNACQTTLTMQIPPQAEVFADPSLRLLAHVSGATPSRSQSTSAPASVYRSFLYRLRWYSDCGQTQGEAANDGCERQWKVDPDSLGYLEFAAAPEFDSERAGEVFAIHGKNDGSLVGRYTVYWNDTMTPLADGSGPPAPSNATDSPSNEYACNELPTKTFVFCGLEDREGEDSTIFDLAAGAGTIRSFTSDGEYLALVVDLEGEQRGQHVILVFRFEGEFAGNDEAFVAMKHQIASIEYVGPSAKQIWFGIDKNGRHDGHLYIVGEDEGRYRVSWSPRALREIACKALLQAGQTGEPQMASATPTYRLLEKHRDGVIKQFRDKPCNDFEFWPKQESDENPSGASSARGSN